MAEHPPPPGRPGTSTTEPGPRSDESLGRTFPCTRCGADLEFDIRAQALECPYCGHREVIEDPAGERVEEQDLAARLAVLASRRGGAAQGERDTGERRECGSCGARVSFPGTVTSTECPYCGSPLQRAGAHRAADGIPVDGVLPFAVERERARERLREWVGSRWFAPGEFRRRGVQGRFNGVYLPFWTFDAATASRYSGERGEHYWVSVGSGKNRRQVRRTRWYPASGAFRRFFDDVLVCAARGLPADRVRVLEPWPLERLRPFSPELLAGYVAETYARPLEEGFGEARERIEAALRAEARRRIGGDAQRVHSLATRYHGLTCKHLLLPLWLLTYRYRERPYRVVVNAATGEVQGERPYSWVKIALAVLAALVLGGLLAWLWTAGAGQA